MACCGRLTRALRFDRHVCAIDSEAGSGIGFERAWRSCAHDETPRGRHGVAHSQNVLAALGHRQKTMWMGCNESLDHFISAAKRSFTCISPSLGRNLLRGQREAGRWPESESKSRRKK